MTELPVWDKGDLLNRLEGDEELVKELLEIFVEDFQSKWPMLKQALAAGDRNLLSDLAHGLKGAAANIAASRLRQTLCLLETRARTADADTIQGWIDEVERIWPEFLKTIKESDPTPPASS